MDDRYLELACAIVEQAIDDLRDYDTFDVNFKMAARFLRSTWFDEIMDCTGLDKTAVRREIAKIIADKSIN